MNQEKLEKCLKKDSVSKKDLPRTNCGKISCIPQTEQPSRWENGNNIPDLDIFD